MIVLGLCLLGLAFGMAFGAALGFRDGYIDGKRDMLRHVFMSVDRIDWKDDSRGGLI